MKQNVPVFFSFRFLYIFSSGVLSKCDLFYFVLLMALD